MTENCYIIGKTVRIHLTYVMNTITIILYSQVVQHIIVIFYLNFVNNTFNKSSQIFPEVLKVVTHKDVMIFITNIRVA